MRLGQNVYDCCHGAIQKPNKEVLPAASNHGELILSFSAEQFMHASRRVHEIGIGDYNALAVIEICGQR